MTTESMEKPEPSFLDGYKSNFDTLCEAVENGDCVLVLCTDKQTQKKVATLCVISREDDGSYLMLPIAKMFDGNPFDEIDPPE